MESEVYAEFQRITSQNLPNTFYAAFDRHLPRLMAIFREKASKTGKTAEALADIFKIHDEQELHDINTRRTTVIHALPVYLQEDTSGFFRTCTEESEPELGDIISHFDMASHKLAAKAGGEAEDEGVLRKEREGR
ncbi:hypothetical protein CgunFtcFv8_005695 [Champsocephalus gunnari]|uniref:Uncharacterized protein n=1 Tax=Champsocephalus gunnari TaxID=52237 RepID=A0AAN8CW27_CHAGU|nr:hypothetical protein CgunFtcFv8_005695 [Champsocephalus gunnari]